jgi:hypothetical protein
MKKGNSKRKERKENPPKSEIKIEGDTLCSSDDVFSNLCIEKEEKKPEKEKSNLKLYFNSGTQDAIVSFQKETKRKEKEKLYVEQIMPAFEKLVENLINIHKFTGVHNTYDELKNDCVNFLFETIYKFDAERGTNAFSYFNVVAKNWLIIRTKQKTQRTKKIVSLDDPGSLMVHEAEIIEEHNIVHAQEFFMDSSFNVENTVKMLYEIRAKVKTENELTCINAIITIFENIDDIDLLNKSAVLLYMRELSGLSPKQLTRAMQSIKRHYKKSRLDFRLI